MDAVARLALKRQLDRETHSMLLEPDERTETADDLRVALERIAGIPNSVVLVAESDRQLIGYVGATGGAYRRDRHTAYVVIGVLAAASGRGVGGALLEALDGWAGQAYVRRFELTVMASNERAGRLYERHGFLREGCRRACLTVDGGYRRRDLHGQTDLAANRGATGVALPALARAHATPAGVKERR